MTVFVKYSESEVVQLYFGIILFLYRRASLSFYVFDACAHALSVTMLVNIVISVKVNVKKK